ncbi:MAG: hypothetical protein GX062_07790 [Firmicutes bacterium]|jgi:hypothetical protein|nr:hypothetical protein [Bacillota bacterium]
MKYRFEITRRDFRHLSSGRVLYHAPRMTAFPVRLASEIAQRCFALLQQKGCQGPYIVYDPCCGGAYLLTVIGFLHRTSIGELIGSDLDSQILEIARKNLSLLTPRGLLQRKEELSQYVQEYGKESHLEALSSIEHLLKAVSNTPLSCTCFQHDITLVSSQVPVRNANIVITDLPYGNLVQWQSQSEDPIRALFDNIYQVLDLTCSVVAIVADKKQHLQHKRFTRVQFLKIGKRQVALFEPVITGSPTVPSVG